VEDHDAVVGQERAVARNRRPRGVERRDLQHGVCRRDVVAGCVLRDRPTGADVVVQQFQSWCGQLRREPGDADVDVVDVVEVGLFGPAVLGASSGAAPYCRTPYGDSRTALSRYGSCSSL
jgi:hypothetical protein